MTFENLHTKHPVSGRMTSLVTWPDLKFNCFSQKGGTKFQETWSKIIRPQDLHRAAELFIYVPMWIKIVKRTLYIAIIMTFFIFLHLTQGFRITAYIKSPAETQNNFFRFYDNFLVHHVLRGWSFLIPGTRSDRQLWGSEIFSGKNMGVRNIFSKKYGGLKNL